MRLLVTVITLSAVLLLCGGVEAITITQLISHPRNTQCDMYDPCFSPDGNSIVFVYNSVGAGGNDIYNLYLIPPSGGTPSWLLTFGDYLRWPAWSPDGTTIAFLVNNYAADIWSVASTGGIPRQVTTNGNLWGKLSWSPDATRIAFSMLGGSGNYDIWSVPAAGGSPVQLTTAASNELDPAWSPDGDYIAFASDRGGSYEIYVQSLAGGPARQVTFAGNGKHEPAWSPDGHWIAFCEYSVGIWVVSAGGGTPICITSSEYDGTLSWSPDGRSIVFDRWSTDGYRKTDIWLATNLDLGPTVVNPTTWGSIKAMFR